MEWYMIIVYAILMFGAISSFLNYRLQHNWFLVDQADRQKNLEDYPTQSTRSLPEDFIPENYRGYEPLDPYSKPKGYNYGGIMV